MFSIKTYFLLLHTIQWTVPPYSVPSVSFQFYLLYFCTAVRFLCNCTGLFRLYFNECFLFLYSLSLKYFFFFSYVSRLTFSVVRTSFSLDLIYMNVSLLYVFIIACSFLLSTYFSKKI